MTPEKPSVENRIDISEPIAKLCERLGFAARDVRHIDFEPTRCIVEVFTRDDTGHAYLEDDKIATTTHEIWVRT